MSRSRRSADDERNVLTLDSGLDALQSNQSFRGPVESLDGHPSHEHMALIYEDRDQQLAATVPYLVQGLERGERCMCLLAETDRGAVVDGLRAADVDVDAALESGALTFHTVDETYVRDETFDSDEMISFYEDCIEEATREYGALRVTAEMTWILDQSTSMEEFMTYESEVNELFHDEDCIGVCQYDRNRVPPEILRDVIRTHPHLIYDNTVCHNFYYTPPEEFFGPEQPGREVDRMMGTLVDRTEAKAELRERKRFLRQQNDITGKPDRSFEEKLQALLEMGCERFGLELGAMARVDPAADRFVLEHVCDDHQHFEEGLELELSETYCTAVTETGTVASVTDPVADGYGDVTVHREFGLQAYLGTFVEIDGDHDRTLFFVSSEPREESFSEEEHTYQQLMGQWVKYELEQRGRERTLNELYETAADPDHSFESKVKQLLELGCSRLDLQCGAFSRITDDTFETIAAGGDREQHDSGNTAPLSETYCRELLERNGPLAIEHATEQGWEDDDAYERWEYESYVGTTVTLGSEPYGTLCFADETPRDRPFSEDERTFLELTSQWISYELEREHRETQLAALNDVARDLMSREDETAVAEAAVENAGDALALPITAVVTFDRETGTLTPVAQTDRAADELPVATLCDRDSGPCWEGFVANEVRTVDDLADLAGAGSELTEVVAVPLGAQGLHVTATTDRRGYCEAERDLIEATAATVETATVRTDRERKLQKRERTLEAQNETLERLGRVNDIIRSIDQALVQAATRSEIETVVCEQLATVGPYELAWIGDHDAVADEITPSESAGAEKGYLDDHVIDLGDEDASAGPVARALETREPQVVNDVLSDERCATWRQEALNRGYHATVSLPLIYQDKLYGVLNVYAGQPGVFDDLERSVLAELSDTIAYAINAVESKKSLVNDERTILEFDVHDDALPFLTIAREAGCTASLDRVIQRSDGQLHGYFTTRGVPADDVLVLQSSLPVTELRLIAERDDDERCCHFEASLQADSLAATVVEHGSRLREVSAADGSASVVIEIAADADIREFVEMFQTRYPDSSLVAQRSEERDDRTAAEFHVTFTDELTPRQLEAIQTAYFNGFFERPRPRTGKEIADAMDISQPTFNAHLRTAQRKLCERLFEEEAV